MTRTRFAALLSLALSSFVVMAMPAAAQDVITVGTVTSSGSTVDVPVSIRDTAGTPLGVDQPAGSHIQSFSIKVTYAPASAVASVTFTRAGITAGLTPQFELSPSSTGSISLLDTFSESTAPLPFRLNAAPPGDKVAHLVFTLAASAAPGTTITVTLDPSLTQLTDQGGSAATKETVANGQLALVNGSITVAPLSIALTPSPRTVSAGATANMSVVASAAVSSNTTVTLSSSATDVATVPSSVVIPAGATAASFKVTGVAVGNATITASIPSGASTQASVAVQAATACPPLDPPDGLVAPSSANRNAPYTITWTAVSGAGDYIVDESTDATFATVSSSAIVSAPSATFTHDTPDIRYYYRVRARNVSTTCNVVSAPSEAVNVLINADVAAPAKGFFAVVGSVPGSFGAYFRTAVQLYNATATPIAGRIVFHPQGASGSAADPSLAFALAPGKTIAYDDLVPAMGLASGIGSADVIADGTSALPVALVRVFNDAGSAGTTGVTEDLLLVDQALHAGNAGVLIAPADVTRFRLNLGIRTLDAGATMTLTVRDRDGAITRTVTKTYGPTFFVQSGAAGLLDGYAFAGGETITFELTSGDAIIYGATTDNITNDPAVQLAKQVR